MFEAVESLLEAKSTFIVQDERGTTPLEYSLSSIPLASLFAHALTVNVSGIHLRSSFCSNGLDRSAILASYCEALLNLYPANPLIHFSLGYRYFQLNQLFKAISSFDRYIALTPANRRASRIEEVVHHHRIRCTACRRKSVVIYIYRSTAYTDGGKRFCVTNVLRLNQVCYWNLRKKAYGFRVKISSTSNSYSTFSLSSSNA